MSLVIERTTKWSRERLDPFVPSIVECLQRLVDQFPTDETVPNLVGQVILGHCEMWVVYDTDQPPQALMVGLTRNVVMEATGQRKFELYNCGGEGLKDCLKADLLTVLEQYGASLHDGETVIRTIVRPGIAKYLRPLGYQRRAEILEKRVVVNGRNHQPDTDERAA